MARNKSISLDDQEHEAKIQALQNALIAGEESGPPAPFDSSAFLAKMHAKHAPDPRHCGIPGQE